MITEVDQGWLRRDLEYGLHRGACRAAMMLYSEQVAFNRPQDTRSTREARGSSPSSDDSSNTTRHKSSRSLLEKGIKKDLSEANPGAAMLPTSQRQRTLRWHMLHIPHIFTRHCKAFIWVWVSGASERGRFVGIRGKTVVAVHVS